MLGKNGAKCPSVSRPTANPSVHFAIPQTLGLSNAKLTSDPSLPFIAVALQGALPQTLDCSHPVTAIALALLRRLLPFIALALAVALQSS